MTQYVFFSWQSDTDGEAGRYFIETCMKAAIKVVKADADLDPANRELKVDRDTRDVPGLPPILDTIFLKIDRSAAFLSDLTYVATRKNGDLLPNSNVCIEHGYALKARTWRRLIAVMNTAFGSPDDHELPFDLKHVRRPICFHLPEGAEKAVRREAQAQLVKDLAVALRTILADPEIEPDTPPAPHPHDVEQLQRFRRLLALPLLQFLREHDFGAPYVRATLDPLHRFNETWVGAAFEFQDKKLQAAFVEMRQASLAFGSSVVAHTHAVDSNLAMASPKTDFDRRHGLQASTETAIADVNAKGTALTAAFDSFERVARERVRVVSDAHVDSAPPAFAAEDTRLEGASAALAELAFDRMRGGMPELVSKPRLTLRFAPLAAHGEHRLSLKVVADQQSRFPPDPNVRAFDGVDDRQWWTAGRPQRQEAGRTPEIDWLMRLVRPGHLEYQVNIGRRINDDPEILINGLRLEAAIIHHFERMALIADGLGLAGPARLELSLDGMDDVELTGARAGGRRIGRPDLQFRPLDVEYPTAPLASGFQDLFDRLWLTSGWRDGSPSFGEGTWRGYTAPQLYEPF